MPRSHTQSVILVYNICLALFSAALLGVGTKAASPPLCCTWCLLWLYLTYWVSLVLQGVSKTPWIFARAIFSDVSNLYSLERSALGISFDALYLSDLLVFHWPNYLEVSALVSSFLSLSSRLAILSGSCLSLCSLLFGILQSYHIYCLATASNIPGSLVLDLCWYCLMKKKVFWVFLPCFPTGLLWRLYFLRLCE